MKLQLDDIRRVLVVGSWAKEQITIDIYFLSLQCLCAGLKIIKQIFRFRNFLFFVKIKMLNIRHPVTVWCLMM